MMPASRLPIISAQMYHIVGPLSFPFVALEIIGLILHCFVVAGFACGRGAFLVYVENAPLLKS